MANMTPEERGRIIALQEGFADVKMRLHEMRRDARELMLMMREAGLEDEANAAFLVMGKLARVRGEVECIHAEASADLARFRDDSGPVIMGGGGGR